MEKLCFENCKIYYVYLRMLFSLSIVDKRLWKYNKSIILKLNSVILYDFICIFMFL